MKLAVSSASFASALGPGGMTHLEWLEACSSRLDADGVVLPLADFPRTDSEYAAQIKKAATDLGLVPVALDVPNLLDPERSDAERSAAVTLAAGVGAALMRVSAGPPGDLPPETFARTVAAAKTLTSLAKAANITLTVSPAAGTLLREVADVQNFAKYVDSAWLRYDLPADAPDRSQLSSRERVLIERIALGDAAPRSTRGWLVLEGDGGADPFERVGAALAALRKS